MVDEVSKEDREQQNSNATDPEEKMLGQLWGIDFLFVHGGRILPKFVEVH